MLTPRRLWPLLLLLCSPTVTILGTLPAQLPDRVVPLDGEAMADGQCVPLIDEIVQHPNWSFAVATLSHNCEGPEEIRGAYEVYGDGRVRYDAEEASYWLSLTPDQLERVRTLGSRSCEADWPHYGRSLRISLGAPSSAFGVRVSTNSMFGAALDDILLTARYRYFTTRREELAHARRVVKFAHGTIIVSALEIQVWYRRHLVFVQDLPAEDFVRAIETIDHDIRPDDPRAPWMLQSAASALEATT